MITVLIVCSTPTMAHRPTEKTPGLTEVQYSKLLHALNIIAIFNQFRRGPGTCTAYLAVFFARQMIEHRLRIFKQMSAAAVCQ